MCATKARVPKIGESARLGGGRNSEKLKIEVFISDEASGYGYKSQVVISCPADSILEDLVRDKNRGAKVKCVRYGM